MTPAEAARKRIWADDMPAEAVRPAGRPLSDYDALPEGEALALLGERPEGNPLADFLRALAGNDEAPDGTPGPRAVAQARAVLGRLRQGGQAGFALPPHYTGWAEPDALGRRYYYEDGVRVPGHEDAPRGGHPAGAGDGSVGGQVARSDYLSRLWRKVEALGDRLSAARAEYRRAHQEHAALVARVQAGELTREQAWPGMVRLVRDADASYLALKAAEAEVLPRVRAALAAPRPVALTDERKRLTRGQEKELDAGLAFVRSVTAAREGVALHARFVRGKEDRAFCASRLGGQAFGVSLDRSGSDAGTVAHEVGHGLETALPGALDLCRRFVQERAGAEEPVRLAEKFPGHGYEPHEKGRKDDWGPLFEGEASAYYVGKTYGSLGTEVLSMGVELLYRDPVRFARKDPEYFKLVVGILHGVLP